MDSPETLARVTLLQEVQVSNFLSYLTLHQIDKTNCHRRQKHNNPGFSPGGELARLQIASTATQVFNICMSKSNGQHLILKSAVAEIVD